MPRDNNSDAFAAAVNSILLLVLNTLLGVFILCQWLTRLLFQFVLNPWLKGALDRHDGLVIALAGGLWSCVFMGLYGWLVYPEIAAYPTSEQVKIFWVVVGCGCAYGIAIGTWILLLWWSEVPPLLEPPYEPVERLSTPMKLMSAPPVNGQQVSPSQAELEQEVEEVFGRDHASEPI